MEIGRIGKNQNKESGEVKKSDSESPFFVASLICQNAVRKLFTDSAVSFDTAMKRMACILSELWPVNPHPFFRITIGDRIYESEGINPDNHLISREIEWNNSCLGKIEVNLQTDSRFLNQPVSLNTHNELLSEIAHLLGWFAGNNEKELAWLEKEKTYISAMELQKHEFSRQNERLNAILVSMPDTVFIHDFDGVCIDYYRTADPKTFFPEESIVGSKLEDIFNPHHAAVFLTKMREAIRTGEPVIHEYEIEIKGHKYYYESNISSLGHDHVLVLSRDITDKKLTDRELKESIRTRDKMFSIISHDLRGPVGSLIPMAELLASDSLTEVSKKDVIEGIKKTVVAINNLLENLLGWAKLQTKTLVLDQGNIDLNRIIHDCVDLVMPFSTLKSITIGIEDQKDLWVYADRNSINLVIRNLLDNAIKFTPVGGIIRVKAWQESDWIITEVVDNGSGMDPEFRNKLFVNDSRAAADNGNGKITGLGLMLCKDFVERNGGTITVESRRGEGTRFVFSLKKGESPVGKKQLPKENLVIEPGKLYGRRILIVEDDSFSQIYEKTLIGRWQATADLAGNGREAIDMLRDNQYDIVLMDIKMPVMDGFEAIGVIRNELKLKIPVFAVSAYVNESIIKKAITSGFDDYMVKPVDPQILYSKILQFLELDFKTTFVQKDKKNTHVIEVTRLTDPEKLKKIFDNDKTLIAGMIRKFLEITPVYYNEMISAFDNQDMLLLRQAAHKLKSSLQLLAGNEMINGFKQLYELTADTNNFPGLTPLFNNFRTWYPLLCHELENDLEKM